MNRPEIELAFIEIIVPFIRSGNVGEITQETRLIEDLNINSARLVDIILDIEDKFGIAIDDGSAGGLNTVGDAIDIILAKTAGK